MRGLWSDRHAFNLQLRTVSGGLAIWNATTVAVPRSRRRARTFRPPPSPFATSPQVDLVLLEITMSWNLFCSRFERSYMRME